MKALLAQRIETEQVEDGLPPGGELLLQRGAREGREENVDAVAVANNGAFDMKSTGVEECIIDRERTEDVITETAATPELLCSR